MSDLDTRLLPSLLLSLPTELLARIVELVHLQDVAFRSRVARLEDLDDADVGLWKQEWGGKTLAQLALVSKLFHALAVPHQFESFATSHALEPFTLSHILVHHAAHFAKLVLDGEGQDLRSTFAPAAANLLHRISHITITSDGAYSVSLLGLSDIASSPSPPLAIALTDTLLRMRSIQLHGEIEPGQMATLLWLVPLADHVVLSGSALEDLSGRIGLALSNLAHLRELELNLFEAYESGYAVPKAWASQQWASPPRRLKISFPAVAQRDWDFIMSLADTLEHLELHFIYSIDARVDGENYADLSDSVSFANLTSLVLDSSSTRLKANSHFGDPSSYRADHDALRILTQLSVSPLVRLTYHSPSIAEPDTHSKLLRILVNNLPALRILAVHIALPSKHISTIVLMSQICKTRGIIFRDSLDADADFVQPPPCVAPDAAAPDESVEVRLLRTLEWATGAARLAAQEGDSAMMRRLLELVRPLEAERVAILDER